MASVLGSNWRKVGDKKPATGKEITHWELSMALRERQAFTKEEVDGFALKGLKVDSFVKVGEEYFEQAASHHCPKRDSDKPHCRAGHPATPGRGSVRGGSCTGGEWLFCEDPPSRRGCPQANTKVDFLHPTKSHGKPKVKPL
mmetsp:Transcript_65291/g.129204  ORF Transcript_65291/g.129204 Transcript_65291/m.129204 type:complete len:142 (-) Transcript_65291:201-626(-)